MEKPKYFALSEFLKSDTAVALGIENFPDWEEVETMASFAVDVLDVIHDRWNQPLIISSGYRVPALNAAVGGSPTSDHQDGLAVDLKLPSWSTRKISDLYNLIYDMVEQGEIDIDQVIYYRRKKIVHIGAGRKLRKQFIVK